jgi:hypothetical protein
VIFNTQHSLWDTFERLESRFMISFLIHDDSSIPHCLLLHLALPYLDWALFAFARFMLWVCPDSCILEWCWILSMAVVHYNFLLLNSCPGLSLSCGWIERQGRKTLCCLTCTQELLDMEFVEPCNCKSLLNSTIQFKEIKQMECSQVTLDSWMASP